MLLLSVPYALKAGDAQTVGGLPPSAFVLAAPPAGENAASATAGTAGSSSPSAPPPPGSSNVTTSGGTAGTIPMYTAATNIQNSLLTQTGTTAINVSGKLNLPATGTATATAGKNSQPHDFVASAFNSGSKAAVAQTFQLQTEPAGNNTATPSGTLNLLYGSGAATPAETGLKISNKGLITFATGQTFPGTGTITKVMAGTDLTGGGTTGNVTLNLDTTKIPQLNVANTFIGNQAFKGNLSDTGNISATGSISAATGAFTANNSSQTVSVKQNGSGNGITSVANGGVGLSGTGAIGVLGTSGPSTTDIGVDAVSSNGWALYAATTNGLAVFADSDAPNAVGSIEGFAGSNAAGANTPGVTGYSTTPQGVGTHGVWSTASTVGVTTKNVGSWGDSSAGDGVHGTSDSGVGVVGQSASFHGVSGVSAGAGASGVMGMNNTAGGSGVSGSSTKGIGVSGQSSGNNAVQGFAHSADGSGVAGFNDAKDATGVYGSNQNGYGFVTDSNVSQGRSMGGWVKAMAYIDGGGTIHRCFNSNLTGSTAATLPCGITVTVPGKGELVVDFGFEVDDRFVAVNFISTDPGNYQFYALSSDGYAITNTQVQVEDTSTFLSNFYIFVY